MYCKKLVFTLLGVFCLSLMSMTVYAYSNDAEFVQALDWMYKNDMTRYNTVSGFMPGETITREQAAKFLSEYVKTTYPDYEERRTAESCQFKDLGVADETLKESIVTVCRFGLMKGVDSIFRPKDRITKAEAVTTLVRIDTGLLDESTSPWWQPYYLRAYNEGYTKEKNTWNLDKGLSRYEMALLLSRAAGNEFSQESVVDINEIAEILGLWQGVQEQ